MCKASVRENLIVYLKTVLAGRYRGDNPTYARTIATMQGQGNDNADAILL